ncbi:hypothetical protein [Cerasicoccus arenae]|uniref:hypothetical protein n=1 Tax=Cerasicoccus arenae TaxID=424488 RepID=UPI0036722410
MSFQTVNIFKVKHATNHWFSGFFCCFESKYLAVGIKWGFGSIIDGARRAYYIAANGRQGMRASIGRFAVISKVGILWPILVKRPCDFQ